MIEWWHEFQKRKKRHTRWCTKHIENSSAIESPLFSPVLRAMNRFCASSEIGGEFMRVVHRSMVTIELLLMVNGLARQILRTRSLWWTIVSFSLIHNGFPLAHVWLFAHTLLDCWTQPLNLPSFGRSDRVEYPSMHGKIILFQCCDVPPIITPCNRLDYRSFDNAQSSSLCRPDLFGTCLSLSVIFCLSRARCLPRVVISFSLSLSLLPASLHSSSSRYHIHHCVPCHGKLFAPPEHEFQP